MRVWRMRTGISITLKPGLTRGLDIDDIVRMSSNARSASDMEANWWAESCGDGGRDRSKLRVGRQGRGAPCLE